MIRRPPVSTRTDTLVPSPTRFLSAVLSGAFPRPPDHARRLERGSAGPGGRRPRDRCAGPGGIGQARLLHGYRGGEVPHSGGTRRAADAGCGVRPEKGKRLQICGQGLHRWKAGGGSKLYGDDRRPARRLNASRSALVLMLLITSPISTCRAPVRPIHAFTELSPVSSRARKSVV